jgi:hypothetical protein
MGERLESIARLLGRINAWLTPAPLWRLDRRLVTHHPLVWRTKLHWVAWWSVLASLFVLGLAEMVQHPTAKTWSVDDVEATALIICYLTAGSVIGWAVFQLRTTTGELALSRRARLFALNACAGILFLLPLIVFGAVFSLLISKSMIDTHPVTAAISPGDPAAALKDLVRDKIDTTQAAKDLWTEGPSAYVSRITQIGLWAFVTSMSVAFLIATASRPRYVWRRYISRVSWVPSLVSRIRLPRPAIIERIERKLLTRTPILWAVTGRQLLWRLVGLFAGIGTFSLLLAADLDKESDAGFLVLFALMFPLIFTGSIQSGLPAPDARKWRSVIGSQLLAGALVPLVLGTCVCLARGRSDDDVMLVTCFTTASALLSVTLRSLRLYVSVFEIAADAVLLLPLIVATTFVGVFLLGLGLWFSLRRSHWVKTPQRYIASSVVLSLPLSVGFTMGMLDGVIQGSNAPTLFFFAGSFALVYVVYYHVMRLFIGVLARAKFEPRAL